MKKGILFIVSAILCFCLTFSAVAEMTVREISASDVTLNKYSGAMAIKEKNSKVYRLFSPDGELLSTNEYTSAYATDYGFFKVSARSADGVHDDGLVDSTGKEIIPAVYADINVVSARWQVGLKLSPCDADDKDYTFTDWNTNKKSFYRIETADFFLDGEKVGSLPRSDYDGYPTAHGAYICVQNRERQRFYYDRTMSAGRPVDSSSEYSTQYKSGKTTYIHNGSGQVAFVPGCTLTPDEVDKSVVYEKGQALDLQGNVIATAKQNYDYIYSSDEGVYTRVKIYDKCGVIDREMNEIIPPEYDDLSYTTATLDSFGFISAVQDGKFGFVNSKGQVTCPFTYVKDIVSERGTFASVKNLDGTIIVLSAAVGELPEHYADVDFPNYNGSMSFTATNASGEKGVIGLYGNTLIPFSEDNRYVYPSVDGQVVVVSAPGSVYKIYRFDASDLVPASAETEVQPEDGTWTCANGHSGNTGKFCTECGAPMPADDGTWTCENGHSGNTGNFCGECGAPRP